MRVLARLNRRAALVPCVLAIAALTPPAQAQVDCSNPDNLCTGDPCVIAVATTVQSPCVVNFGARTLVIGETLSVPNAGILDFTADDIDVDGVINGRHSSSTSGDASQISLTAATGDINVRSRIDVTGRFTPGSVTLAAAGNIDLRAQLKAQSAGGSATAPGGTVVISAGGILTSNSRGRVKVKGKGSTTDGGSVTMNGGAIDLGGKIDARGNAGGIAVFAGSSGAVIIGKMVEVGGKVSAGGSISVTSPSSVTIDDKLAARGNTAGGMLMVTGGGVSINGEMVTDGGTDGGSITLAAGASGMVISVRLKARGKGVDGGTVTATSTGGLTISNAINVQGRVNGGTVSLSGATLSLLAPIGQPRIDAYGKSGSGGIVTVTSVGDMTVDSEVRAYGDTSGGEVRFSTTAGNMVLGNDFDTTAPTGGVVEGISAGDLTAVGRFEARIAGCIGLTAAGTLDTSGADFDVPLSASCP